MQVIIAGCGRVGAELATMMDAKGHTTAIIDRDQRAFRRLGDTFGGLVIKGFVFDRAALIKAEVERADALVAVTDGDNSNIVAARTARDHFGVPIVVARIYDPRRAEIYERHGVATISTTRWTIDSVLRHLGHDFGRVEATIGPGEGDVVIVGGDLPTGEGPWEVETFARQGRWQVTAITRTGQTTVPVPRQLVQGGERVHLAVQRSVLADAEAFLATFKEA